MLKKSLQQAMGEASRAEFETGSVTWKKAKDSVVLDITRLREEHADLLQGYVASKAGSRRFLIV